MKKWTLGLVIATMLVTLVGCGTNNNNNSQNQPANQPSNQGSTASEQPAEALAPIKIFVPDLNKAIPTEDLSKNATINYMEEKAGVKLDVNFIADSNYLEQLKLKFVANDYPDVYMGYGITQGDGALENGLILPLNDLIDQYGPNLKSYISQEAWDAVTINGQIMAIPEMNVAPSSKMLYVRQDWLEKLNLEVPTTSDELLDLWRAIRDGDPNGNGQKDEIAFTTREKFSYVIDIIFGMWGVQPYEGIEYNGEIMPGFAHPNFKKGLEFLQIAYDEGLLDSEFLVNASSQFSQKIYSDLVGTWGFGAGNAYSFHNKLQENVPTANVITIPTPQGAGYEGPVGGNITPINKSYLITTKAKNPEQIIKLFDWLVTEEGQIFSELGLEGVNYSVENGAIVYNPESEAENKTEWRAVFKMHSLNDQAFKAKNNEVAQEKFTVAYNIANSEGIPSATLGMPALSQELFNLYYEYHEPAARIIIEGLPVDETWDAFIAEWRKNGGDEMIAEMTKWVQENKQ